MYNSKEKMGPWAQTAKSPRLCWDPRSQNNYKLGHQSVFGHLTGLYDFKTRNINSHFIKVTWPSGPLTYLASKPVASCPIQ